MGALKEFDRTVNTSEKWIIEVSEELGTDDYSKALQGFRATIHVLRDRVKVNDATNLGSQLPVLLAGYYYEGWNPAEVPVAHRNKKDFLDAVQLNIQNLSHSLDANECVPAVLSVLSKRISDGQMNKIKSNMPDDLLELWP
ncbi:DUF2267 domain-containing protein [Rhodohalobacter sp. 8-1]|uniref:DUF2267 domain-containing protein n=1 Tax=Rhodohalobacter sp. 8-1 TaxID=3131972 RepID=UPI0030EC54DD